MDRIYEKYKGLKIDGSWIGLASEEGSAYFCTPEGAEIIGWDNGIHYCFIDGFGDMVFCVNPESCENRYVYPIAEEFGSFLRLILAVGHTNVLQQIIVWDKKDFEDFVNNPAEREYAAMAEVRHTLNAVRSGLGIDPIKEPFEYVKKVQKGFDYGKIRFSSEYYDTLGIEFHNGEETGKGGFEFDTVVFCVRKN